MQSDRERARQLCELTSHDWREEYYGWRCENCGEFVPYGSEPWAEMDDAYPYGWDSYETEISP